MNKFKRIGPSGLKHMCFLLNTVHELAEEQDNLKNGQQLNDNASDLKQQLNLMRDVNI